MARRLGTANAKPPEWTRQFAQPACFRDARDWLAWIEAARVSASVSELKAMQRGQCPNPCPDCDPASKHRQDAVRDGVCIPIVVAPRVPEEA